MRILIALLLIAAAAPVSAAETPASETPGSEPQTCLANRDIQARRMTAEQGYYVRTSKGWWHNLGPSCSAYGRNRALITRTLNNQQCRGDVVTVVDPFSRIEFGACALGAWQQVDKAEVPPAKAK
jgi:hypothetical protein